MGYIADARPLSLPPSLPLWQGLSFWGAAERQRAASGGSGTSGHLPLRSAPASLEDMGNTKASAHCRVQRGTDRCWWRASCPQSGHGAWWVGARSRTKGPGRLGPHSVQQAPQAPPFPPAPNRRRQLPSRAEPNKPRPRPRPSRQRGSAPAAGGSLPPGPPAGPAGQRQLSNTHAGPGHWPAYKQPVAPIPYRIKQKPPAGHPPSPPSQHTRRPSPALWMARHGRAGPGSPAGIPNHLPFPECFSMSPSPFLYLKTCTHLCRPSSNPRALSSPSRLLYRPCHRSAPFLLSPLTSLLRGPKAPPKGRARV